METTIEKPAKSDSEEEDYESFFLQPASSPYNIKEKLKEANRALMEENSEKTEKQFKVKFREALVDYEPDLTDDDVESIESFENDIAQPHPEELTYILQTNQIFNIPEEIEDDEIIEEINADEINEEIIEELKEELTEELNEEIIETPKEIPVREIRGNRQKTSKTRRKTYPVHIDCRNHCIEELESRLDLCISKLNIHDKPVCPTLKLQRRKCCEENRSQQKLPLYTGSRSEYGLSASQLYHREKRREIIKLQEQKRFQVQQEYRKRQIEQNEDIFKQWLKDISERKMKNSKKRPQTVKCQSRINVTKERRPHSSCIFVNIPESVLEEGLVVGGVVIGRSTLSDRQLEMMTYS